MTTRSGTPWSAGTLRRCGGGRAHGCDGRRRVSPVGRHQIAGSSEGDVEQSSVLGEPFPDELRVARGSGPRLADRSRWWSITCTPPRSTTRPLGPWPYVRPRVRWPPGHSGWRPRPDRLLELLTTVAFGSSPASGAAAAPGDQSVGKTRGVALGRGAGDHLLWHARSLDVLASQLMEVVRQIR